MRKTRINPVSKKRQERLDEYYPLRDKLISLANGVSELSGKRGLLEPHHVDGREGGLLLDPFNILLVLPVEHRAIQEYRSSYGYSKEYLLWLVKSIRSRQGF